LEGLDGKYLGMLGTPPYLDAIGPDGG